MNTEEYPGGVASLAGAMGAGGRPWEIAVGGSSMRPLIAPGDRVMVRPSSLSTIKPGRIFAYWKDSRIVVHRVIARRKGPLGWRFLQVGDGGAEADWVEGPAVLGTVIRIRKASGAILLDGFPAEPIGIIIGGLDRLMAGSALRGKTAGRRVLRSGLHRLITATARLYPMVRI